MEKLTANHTALLTGVSLSVMALKARDQATVMASVIVSSAEDEHLQPSATMEAAEGHLDASITLANDLLRRHSISLEFEVWHFTNQVVVRLRDTDSGQVIREYSTKTMLAMVASMNMMVGGLLQDVV